MPLVHAIADAFLFLENSTEDQVELRSAVTCMENIASSILELDREDQLALRRDFEAMGDAAEDRGYREFYCKLPDAIQLAAPDDGGE